MADLSFLETDSDRIYETIISQMEELAGEPLYPGDERRIFADSLVAVFVSIYQQANEACKEKMLQYAKGEVLDALGARYNCIRITPTAAQTTLRFSVSAAMAGNIMIPAGTRVTPDNEIYFKTKENVVLQAGKLYVDVAAEACETGASYNDYAVGTLNQLVDLVPYIDEVTNTVVTFDGDDGEPYPEDDGGTGDEKYRDRIYLAPTALSVAGPHDAYLYHVKSADSTIADAAIISDYATRKETLTVHGGCAFLGGRDYHVSTLVVEGCSIGTDYSVDYENGELLKITLKGSKAMLTSINISIKQDMAGQVLIVPILDGGAIPDDEMLEKVRVACSQEDVRPMTDLVITQAPEQIPYDIKIKYYTTEDEESDCISTIEGKDGAISKFKEWQGTKLGRDINPDKLRSLCLAPAEGKGCKRIEITAPEFTVLEETQVAVFSGTYNAIHVVEEE